MTIVVIYMVISFQKIPQVHKKPRQHGFFDDLRREIRMPYLTTFLDLVFGKYSRKNITYIMNISLSNYFHRIGH